MRRLPVYLLIDTSGSMRGEPIASVNTGLQTMLASLRQDPHALESVHLAIWTFDREVNNVLPLTELSDIQLPEIETPDSGPTMLGRALTEVLSCVDSEVRRGGEDSKGDWMPLLFIMTDGKPSDLADFNGVLSQVKAAGFGAIVACAAGPKAKSEYLQMLTDRVVTLDTLDANGFEQFFKWVSASVSVGNRSVGVTDDISLPPPPPELNIVI